MANPPQWSSCPRTRFGVHQTDPKMAPPWTRRCKKDAWKIIGPKTELKTGAAWRPHPYTYFVLTDPFRGPPGGPQNGAAPDMAIPKTWLGQSPKMKAGPKREPPGGPNSGAAKLAANPTKGMPYQKSIQVFVIDVSCIFACQIKTKPKARSCSKHINLTQNSLLLFTSWLVKMHEIQRGSKVLARCSRCW